MKASKILLPTAIASIIVLSTGIFVANQDNGVRTQASMHTSLPLLPNLSAEQRAAQQNLAQISGQIAQLEAAVAKAESLIAESEELLDETENSDEEEITMIAGWEVHDDALLLEEPEIPLGDQIRIYEKVSASRPDSLPSEGDKVEMSLLNGEKATVEVKRGVFSQNGDYSWSGHLEGYGTDYPVVVTYGDNASFAMITTPEGSYSMESVNGTGWLYKNPSEEELTTPGSQDYLDIPGSNHDDHDH